MFVVRVLSPLLLLVAISPRATYGSGLAHSPGEEGSVTWTTAAHRINQVKLTVTDRGSFGLWRASNAPFVFYDPFVGDAIITSLEYPAGSGREYLDGMSIWIGALDHGLPRVSSGVRGKFWTVPPGDFAAPAEPPAIHRRGPPDLSAVSEEDFYTLFSDSIAIGPPLDLNRRENIRALGVCISQESYGWSYLFAEDFIIVQLQIRNCSGNHLDGVYIGLHAEPNVGYPLSGGADDQIGYMVTGPPSFGCALPDSIDCFWFADNDGDPYYGEFVRKPRMIDGWRRASTRSVVGIRPLAGPTGTLPTAFNWWSSKVSSSGDEIVVEPCIAQGFGACNGVVFGLDDEALMYQRMSNDEFDYNPLMAAILSRYPTDVPWNHIPLDIANQITVGSQYTMLLSWGPLQLPPGGATNLTFAVVGGENFHSDVDNLLHLPSDVESYLSNVDFSDLSRNALMAGWVYDNPGVDTDGDGYAGEYRVCVRESALVNGEWMASVADTQWYKGDGIPDYNAVDLPTPPDFWLSSTHNGIHIRFNGQVTETEEDIFLQKRDFEGYRVYLGRDEREASLSLVASYDREDYDKFLLNTQLEVPSWELRDEPFTMEELRCLYGRPPQRCMDSAFDPLAFSQLRPYRDPDFPNDSIFFFRKHHYNTSQPGVNTGITKRFPDMPDPRTLPADSITPDMYTEDGYLKFYEYECTIANLLPSVPYSVNVTAFDFGSPAQGITPLESDKTGGVQEGFPFHERDRQVSGDGQVYVYPNPYRIDAGYRDLGFEGRAQDDRWDERVRSIWFANLPPKCRISIYTLDGDRVRAMDHDMSPGDPSHTHHRWSLINRNQQKVEAGLYYWVVEVPGGETQMGKLVILR